MSRELQPVKPSYCILDDLQTGHASNLARRARPPATHAIGETRASGLGVGDLGLVDIEMAVARRGGFHVRPRHPGILRSVIASTQHITISQQLRAILVSATARGSFRGNSLRQLLGGVAVKSSVRHRHPDLDQPNRIPHTPVAMTHPVNVDTKLAVSLSPRSSIISSKLVSKRTNAGPEWRELMRYTLSKEAYIRSDAAGLCLFVLYEACFLHPHLTSARLSPLSLRFYHLTSTIAHPPNNFRGSDEAIL